jgi:uncharacterized protein
MQKSTRMVVIENFGSCNLRCAYCFPEHMWQRQGHHGVIKEEIYRNIIEHTLSTTSSDTIDVHFAGGEPLLAGRAWFEMAFRIAREIADRHGKKVTFSLQTNANFLTAELTRFLVDNEATVGVSLDGPPGINEAVRGNTDGTLAGLDRLTEALGRRPGIIVTVTRCNALRMHEVIDYLDSLGVALFRANQMGATASWNVHAAPRAEEWAKSRQTIFEQIAVRNGRIMEFNLSEAVGKFARSVLDGASPFGAGCRCCDMRCSAGRQLIYFDQKGNAYPCPRANVSVEAWIGNLADPDFDYRWDRMAELLDASMAIPTECQQCPAQLICDYGCHAFNTAQGNFFEVNCDGTKEYFNWISDHLEEMARILLYIAWRERLKMTSKYSALRAGIALSQRLVDQLAGQLRHSLAQRLAGPDLVSDILGRRYGWRSDLVPMATVNRHRISGSSVAIEGASKGGDR